MLFNFPKLYSLPEMRGFVNCPFDEQLSYFPEFGKWRDQFKGKLNIISLHYGDEPYAIFTRGFFPNATDHEKIMLTKLK